MAALFDHLPILDNEYAVGTPHGTQAMRNDYNSHRALLIVLSVPRQHIVDSLLNQVLLSNRNR